MLKYNAVNRNDHKLDQGSAVSFMKIISDEYRPKNLNSPDHKVVLHGVGSAYWDAIERVKRTLHDGLPGLPIHLGAGYMVSWATPGDIIVDDIFEGFSKEQLEEIYQKAKHDQPEEGLEFSGQCTKENLPALFWNLMWNQVLSMVTVGEDGGLLHLESNIASVFNGYNRYGISFELKYYEEDVDDGEVYCTNDLAQLLMPRGALVSTFGF